MQYITLDSSVGILVFEISSIEFGCNIDKIRLLDPSKKYLLKNGEIEYNGKEIILFDLGKIFSLNSKVPLRKKNALLYEFKDIMYGLLIDSVKEVLNLDRMYMEKFEKVDDNNQNQLLLGKLNFEGSTILFPDIDVILERNLIPIRN